MLTDLTPLVDLITDADLATNLRTWLKAQADLNPAPTAVTHTPPNPNQTD